MRDEEEIRKAMEMLRDDVCNMKQNKERLIETTGSDDYSKSLITCEVMYATMAWCLNGNKSTLESQCNEGVQAVLKTLNTGGTFQENIKAVKRRWN